MLVGEAENEQNGTYCMEESVLHTTYVPVNFKTAHAPPPGKPPGIWLSWKILVKFPTMLPV